MVLVTLASLCVTLVSFTRFLVEVEDRRGVLFADPIHALLGPFNLTWPIFVVLYGALLIAVVTMGRMPMVLFKALRAYTLLVALRLICMWLLPLDPPGGMIVLHDPFVELFTTGSAHPLTRDLFFSGHTSILCMVAFVIPQRNLKLLFSALALFVGVAVVLQHVHYTIDVVVAPLAAWAAVTMSGARNAA